MVIFLQLIILTLIFYPHALSLSSLHFSFIFLAVVLINQTRIKEKKNKMRIGVEKRNEKTISQKLYYSIWSADGSHWSVKITTFCLYNI